MGAFKENFSRPNRLKVSRKKNCSNLCIAEYWVETVGVLNRKSFVAKCPKSLASLTPDIMEDISRARRYIAMIPIMSCHALLSYDM